MYLPYTVHDSVHAIKCCWRWCKAMHAMVPAIETHTKKNNIHLHFCVRYIYIYMYIYKIRKKAFSLGHQCTVNCICACNIHIPAYILHSTRLSIYYHARQNSCVVVDKCVECNRYILGYATSYQLLF